MKKNHPDDDLEVVEEAERGTREFDHLRFLTYEKKIRSGEHSFPFLLISFRTLRLV